jgi:hypothetical protein
MATLNPYIQAPDSGIKYYLAIIEIRDDLPQSLVIHEFPYSDKNIVKNLGRKTRKIHIECAFYANASVGVGSDGVLPTYAAHYDFLNSYETEIDGWTLNHPQYGEMQGQINNLNVFHDDTKEYAAVSFDFYRISEPVPNYQPQYIGAKQSKEFGNTSRKTLALLNSAKTAAKNVTKWIAEATIYRNKLNGYLNDITSPVNSIIYSLSYATDLPSQVLLSINGAVDRLVTANQTVINTPAVYINSLIVAARAFKDTFTDATEAKYVKVMSASRISYEASVVLEADEANNVIVNNKSNTKTFDEGGNALSSDIVPPVLTYNELETLAYDVRSYIDEAIQLDRDNRSLQEQGVSLQEYIDKIKLEREKIEVQQVPIQSLHQLAVSTENSYQKAEQLLKLNPGIKNPTFAFGNLKVLIPSG